jgi:hypothetical protein
MPDPVLGNKNKIMSNLGTIPAPKGKTDSKVKISACCMLGIKYGLKKANEQLIKNSKCKGSEEGLQNGHCKKRLGQPSPLSKTSTDRLSLNPGYPLFY